MFFSSQEVIQCVHLGAVTDVYALSPAVYDVLSNNQTAVKLRKRKITALD